MAKGYNVNKERMAEISVFGKSISKRARFCCEWCESKEDLRLWDHAPHQEPVEGTLALLCQRCRELAGGRKADENELRSIRDALWSDIPAVAEGAARVLVQCKQEWVRDAIEESLLDDEVKAGLLQQWAAWK